MNKEVAEVFKRLDLFNLDIKKNIEDIYNRLYITFDDNEISYLLDYIENLKQENKKLHNKIDKLEDKIKQMDNRFKNGLCVDNYLGGKKTRKLFEEMYEILKDSDAND